MIFFRLRLILFVFLGISIFIFYKILKAKKLSHKPFVILSLFFSVLIGSQVLTIVKSDYAGYKKRQSYQRENKELVKKLRPLNKKESLSLPDIYFIILDAYASEKSLNKYYHYKNDWFLKSLKSKGFSVLNNSHSNYACTTLSIPATLNMRYHPSSHPLKMNNNLLFSSLKTYGYQIKNIESSNTVSRKLVVKKQNTAQGYLQKAWASFASCNHFLHNFLKFKTFLFYCSRPLDYFDQKRHRTTIFRQLKQLKESATDTKYPKFIFCHILCPHHPFVFDEKGELGLPSFPDKPTAYPRQVAFISKQVDSVVEHILKNNKKNTIIIIQADHGPNFTTSDFDDRYGILNAWYLPDNKKQLLYETMSPVNNFRFILKHYLKTKIELFDDRSI